MTPTPLKLLHDVIRLAATMPDPHSMVLGIRGVDPSRLGGSGPTDGMPFRLDTTIDFWDTTPGDVRGIRTRTGVQDWAATWAYSWWVWADDESPKPEGDKLLWLLSRIWWAELHYPAFDEFETELAYVHAALQHAHGLDPVTTDRTCPSCGAILEHAITAQGVSDVYQCPSCWNIYTPEGLDVMTASTITSSDRKVTRAEAVRLLGVSASRIRKWIFRGQLIEEAGKISIAEAAQLLRHTAPVVDSRQ